MFFTFQSIQEIATCNSFRLNPFQNKTEKTFSLKRLLKKYFKKKQLLKLDTYNLAYAVAYAAVAYVAVNAIFYSVAYAVAY